MKKIFASILVLSVLFACEKPVTIDVPQKPSKLVINGWIGKDSLISVHVGKSKYSLAPRENINNLTENYTVKNAVPVVFENDVPVDTLVYDATRFIYRTQRGRRISAGKAYSVKVKAPGFTEATAESIVPSQSQIVSLQYVRDARTNSSGTPESEITITFNDPGAEKNYYLIQFFGVYTDQYGNPVPIWCIHTSDKDVEVIGYADPMEPNSCYDGDQLLLSDANFNGKQKVVKFFIESYQLQEFVNPSANRTYRPFVNVLRITEDQFKFIKSYSLYSNSSDNPFAEPVNVFTNVNNGYGVFSTYTRVTDTLR